MLISHWTQGTHSHIHIARNTTVLALGEPPKLTPFGTPKELQMTKCVGKSLSSVPAQLYAAQMKTEQL